MARHKLDNDAPSRSPHVREVDDDVEATESTRLLRQIASSDTAGSKQDEWDGYKDFEGLPWWRRPSVFWLLGPFVMFTLAFGGVMVPKLNLILSLVCKQHFADRAVLDPNQPITPVFIGGDNPQCNIPEVQSKVSLFMLVMNLITGGLSAIVAPRVGKLSDRYGRTRLMAFASTGGLIGEIITVVVAKHATSIDYRWLILGSITDGATGSFTAGSILTQSYTSDSTPPSKRAVYIGYTHACLFTGLALGPLLAGYFVKWTGSLLSVFYVIVACHAAFILIIGFGIPESLAKRKRKAAQEQHAREKEAKVRSMGAWLHQIQKVNPFEPLAILWPVGPGTSTRLRVNLVALAIADMILLGSSIAVGAVIILYSEYTFGWGTLESSKFISALSFVRVITLMGIFPAINYFARVRPARKRQAQGIAIEEKNSGADNIDIWVMRVALISEVLGVIGYILARDENVFFASGMVTALGGLGSATIQATVTKHVPQQRVGQVLGAIGMLHALSRVVGPVIFNGIYAATVGSFDQAFFVVLCGIFGFAFLSTLVLKPHVHWDEEAEEESRPLTRDEDILGANESDHLIVDEDDVRHVAHIHQFPAGPENIPTGLP